MNAITFDTHAFVKRLTTAGMPEAQAEVLADEQTNLIENNLATKRDIKELEVALKFDMQKLEATLTSDMQKLETVFKRDIKELELRLTIRLGGMMIVASGVIITGVGILIKLLYPTVPL